MSKHVTRHRLFPILWPLAGAALLFGCGDDSSRRAGPEQPHEEVAGQSQSLGFADGRTVSVEVWTGSGSAPDPTKTVRQSLYTGRGVLTAIQNACTPTTASSPVHQSLCVGHWAATIAESVAPVYLGRAIEEGPVLVGLERPALVSHRVQPPNASDAASWSLLATEFFRRAVVQGTDWLRDASASDMSETLVQADGSGIARGDLLAGDLSDAMSSMMETAEKARLFVSAAAEAAASKAKDPAAAHIQAWRGVVDSRLEAASLYVATGPSRYQDGGRVPIYRVTHPENPATYSALQVSELPTGYSRSGDPVFWYYAPTVATETTDSHFACVASSGLMFASLGLPGSPGPSWCASGSPSVTHLDARSPSGLCGEELPCLGGTAGWYLSSRAGPDGSLQFGYSPSPLCRPDIGTSTCSMTLVDAHGQPLPSTEGFAGATDGFIGPGNPALEWPVFPRDAATPEEKTAADLILQHRLSPFNTGNQIAADLLALLRQTHAASLTGKTPVDLLASFGIDVDHLDRAALRIRTRANALGRAIVPILGTSSPVQYTVPPTTNTRAVDPAYLFALSEGSNYLLSTQAAAYPTRGVVHAVDYFSEIYLPWSSRTDVPTSVQGLVSRVASYARDISSGTLVVTGQTLGTWSPNGPNRVQSLQIGLRVPEGSDPSELAQSYRVAVGEAGLECAQTQRIAGIACRPEHHTFTGGNWTVSGTDAVLQLTGNQVLRVALGDTSSDALTPAGSIPRDTRLYLLKLVPGAEPEVLTGFAAGTVTLAGGRRFPILSPTLREALTNILAADPESPADAEVSCAGIPENARVKLEDELIPVSTEDKLDTSFQYYLTEARKAADLADSLGEQLLDQGLQMDTRAEDAAAELEGLCGGTVNIGRVQELACKVSDCDLAKLLSKVTSELPLEYRSDVEGARDCFGTRVGSKLTSAAVGNQPLCAWRYAAGGAKYGTCQPCPPGADCPDRCPIGVGDANRCERLLESYSSVEPVSITEQLGLSVTALDEKPTPARLASWLQLRYGLATDSNYLTDLVGAEDPSDYATVTRLLRAGAEGREIWGSWATQANLRNIAMSLGYIEGDGELTLTLNGSKWFSVGEVFANYMAAGGSAPTAGPSPWPCAPVAELGVYCNGGTGSLLCGACSAASVGALRGRLKLSVDLLKGLTGAPLDHMYEQTEQVYRERDLLARGDLAYAGLDPLGNEAEYTVTSPGGDQQLKCVAGELRNRMAQAGWKVDPVPSNSLLCRSLSNAPRLPAMPANPVHLWATGVCDRSLTGCGAIPSFLAGRTSSVRWQERGDEHPLWQVYCRAPGGVGPAWRWGVAELPRGGTWTFDTADCEATPQGGFSMSGSQIVDALSLAYRVHSLGAGGCDTLWREVPAISSVHDFGEVRKAIMCSADRVETQLTRMFLPGIPQDIVDDLRGSVSGTFPEHRGEYGEVLAQLVATAQNLNRQSDSVVQAIRDLGLLFDIASTSLASLDLNLESQDLEAYITELQIQDADLEDQNLALEDKIGNLRKGQFIANQTTSCLTASAAALPKVSCGVPAGCSTEVNGGAVLSAMATCANTATQIGLELAIDGKQDQITENNEEILENGKRRLAAVGQQIQLGKQITEQDKRLVLLDLQQQVIAKADAMNEASTALNETYATIHSLLTRLDTIRGRARRAAGKVLMLDNDDTGRQFNVNTAMRARMNTLRIRYGNARAQAVRATYMARRALEQKLGADLSDMDNQVGWIPAPSSWADELCALSGINYARIRDAERKDPSREAVSIEREGYNYVNAYVGEYVSKLEQFVEAYRLAYPFQDSDDTMVVSLRDELLGIREACDVEGTNLLYNSTLPLGGAWRSGCSDAWCLAPALASDEPFVCDAVAGTDIAPGSSDEQSCRAMGGVRAVKLQYTERQRAGTSTPIAGGPQQPPEEGMVYWYRGDACDPTRTTSACDDLSGNTGRNSGRANGPAVALRTGGAGIGGLPTLHFPQGSSITLASGLAERSEYTLVSVLRANEVGTNELWSEAHFGTDGLRRHLSVQLSEAKWWTVTSSPDTRADLGSVQYVTAVGEVAPHEDATSGDVIVVRGGAAGVEVFVNGNLRARSSRPATPTNFAGYIANASGGAMQVAETAAYGRRLSDSELDALHAYLAGRYGLTLHPPTIWFNADVVQRLRDSGSDTVTGYHYTDGRIHNAATGHLLGEFSGDVDTSDMVPFEGEHVALRFDIEQMSFAATSSISGSTAGTSWSALDEASAGEYVGTLVVDLDTTGAPEHTPFAYSNPLHSGSDHRYVYLKVHCDTGAVGFLNSRLASERLSEPGVVTCGVPFVISIRGSEAEETTDLFVNGVRVLSDDSFDKASYIHFGGRNGLYMRGSMADARFHVSRMTDADVTALHARLGQTYQIPTAGSDDGSVAGGGNNGAAAFGQPAYVQTIEVERGNHWLSWYEPTLCNEPSALGVQAIVEGMDAAQVVPSGCFQGRNQNGNVWREDRWMRQGWSRRFGLVTADRSGAIDVVFSVAAPPVPGAPREEQPSALFAGPQLERIEVPRTAEPNELFPTDDDLRAPLGSCQDSNGDTFRGGGRWTYECEYYCPPTLGSGCEALAEKNELPMRCYWELPFMISQTDIEAGRLIPQGGFAAGNFNYRHNTLAINVVGTAVKDCAGSETASACYANNFLQFTLHHDEPFRVRNFEGRDTHVPLYPGRIQQGKALLAERYLTNPLSGTDRGLLTDFWHSEFRGRPLDGSYTLRVYETDGFEWSHLEDVQLLINYRYWTRLN